MKFKVLAVHLFCLLVLCSTVANGQRKDFYLKDGDRVVFYGDSITEQRYYTTFVETYVRTRWPSLNVSFVNAGWSADRVSGGRGGPIDLRLQRDVLAYHPTVVTVMLGMNDADVRPYDQTLFDIFTNGYRHIVDVLKASEPRLRLTLIRPSPYDDVTREPKFDGGYNSVLVRYGDFIAELAHQMGFEVADLNQPVVAALKKADGIDPDLSQKIISDRVHPGLGGHLLMAQALLKAWNAPATVSAVTIDAKTGRVVNTVNTRISALMNDRGFSWVQEDEALPMPFDLKDPTTALAIKSSDVVETLNEQPLIVHGLTEQNYVLRIDDQLIGKFSRESLDQGINLAMLPTPMFKQAQAVHALTTKHDNVHKALWREIQVPLADENTPTVQRAIDSLHALEAELIKKQRTMAQPKPHRFQLIPQP